MESFIQVEKRISNYSSIYNLDFLVDIKPENFIMTSGGQLRVIDLGLSFRLSHTQASVLRQFAGEKIRNFFQ
jgi:hypothetical protein